MKISDIFHSFRRLASEEIIFPSLFFHSISKHNIYFLSKIRIPLFVASFSYYVNHLCGPIQFNTSVK